MDLEKKERALVLIKPDAIIKNLTGQVITRFGEAEIEITAAKAVVVSRKIAEEHYQHLKNKPFFNDTVRYLQGEFHGVKKILALVVEGKNVISAVRRLAGATNPEEADPRSLRGQFGRITTKGVFENVLHASSSVEDAEREIALWFSPNELT